MSSPEIAIELPDGTRMDVPLGTTPLEIARRIGPGLARAAVSASRDGEWIDLRVCLDRGGPLRLITARDPGADEVIRHSAEHVMADAVKRLWPETQIDVGRGGRDGKLQYDFDIPQRLGPDDLGAIEAEMQRIISEDLPFEREVVSHAEARRVFEEIGDALKLSRIDDIPASEEITLYRHGSFVDVCRGPHVQSTKQIGAFKLTDLAGSYWRGDERNPMLQRIYGLAFSNPKELEAHLALLEEAKKRDHRRLGSELGLFMFHEWSPGSPFYLPRGLRLYNALVDYMRELYERYRYEEVMAPQLFSAELFKVSGHYQNFGDDMYLLPGADEGEELGLKPMNCPGHCLIFRSEKRSYRDLPLRLAEFSRLHRNERSGTLHGMTRVRSMAQDDAHAYCEPEQLADEVDAVMRMIAEVYRDLGLSGVEVCVATRPEESWIGDVADWERAEKLLVDAVERAGFECGISPGEGAFYGPKIECNFKDALGRSWQLSTIQIDMAMPARFGLSYVGRDGKEHQPAMIHRAILGSLERFIGVYLEHTAGNLPAWLAPVQAVVLPIADRHQTYAASVRQALVDVGIRVDVDARNETLSYRIRSSEGQKIPFLLVVGDREEEDRTITVRRRRQKAQDVLGMDALCTTLEEEVKTRGIS